jgi:hypothetical protein
LDSRKLPIRLSRFDIEMARSREPDCLFVSGALVYTTQYNGQGKEDKEGEEVRGGGGRRKWAAYGGLRRNGVAEHLVIGSDHQAERW